MTFQTGVCTAYMWLFYCIIPVFYLNIFTSKHASFILLFHNNLVKHFASGVTMAGLKVMSLVVVDPLVMIIWWPWLWWWLWRHQKRELEKRESEPLIVEAHVVVFTARSVSSYWHWQSWEGKELDNVLKSNILTKSYVVVVMDHCEWRPTPPQISALLLLLPLITTPTNSPSPPIPTHSHSITIPTQSLSLSIPTRSPPPITTQSPLPNHFLLHNTNPI